MYAESGPKVTPRLGTKDVLLKINEIAYSVDMAMTKVFGYMRVSGKGQAADDRDGFPRQREAIQRWASQNQSTVVQWFEDTLTGKTDLEGRPQLWAMLTAIAANGVRTVVIEKLDRLARDLMVQESILADCRRKGITIVSVMEPDICSDDPTRVLLRQMMGAFAEYERKTIVLKLRGARQRSRAKTGHCEGRKPYGALAKEREVIERMFELYDRGCGYTSIHKHLNAEGIKTRMGGEWYAASVMKIMKREPERLHRATIIESFNNNALNLAAHRTKQLQKENQ